MAQDQLEKSERPVKKPLQDSSGSTFLTQRTPARNPALDSHSWNHACPQAEEGGRESAGHKSGDQRDGPETGFLQSIHTILTGIFYIMCASVAICKRYLEMVKAARPDSPFNRFMGNCPVQREERRVIISMRNPHIPGNDIVTFLKCFCTVVRDFTHILDRNGFWTGKWSVIVRFHKDPTAQDGVQRLPQSFSLGNSPGLIYCPDMPQICWKCSKKGHNMKDCKEATCRICRVAGHKSNDCPKRAVCNLCRETAHQYKDCPKRTRAYASAAAKGPARPAQDPAPAAKKREGKRTNRPGRIWRSQEEPEKAL